MLTAHVKMVCPNRKGHYEAVTLGKHRVEVLKTANRGPRKKKKRL